MDNCNICITTESSTADLLAAYPQCCEVFEKHDMPCFECMGAGCETIADCALMHGVDADLLVAELREFLGCIDPPVL